MADCDDDDHDRQMWVMLAMVCCAGFLSWALIVWAIGNLMAFIAWAAPWK